MQSDYTEDKLLITKPSNCCPTNGPNPNIARVRDVHWQGIRGAAVQMLPQAPDNAVNGHLGRARRVKYFL